ncbi:MAG TPA: polysaccharide deacetylase family protein [Gemmatimonadaceae bacterium]|nr:polysaccharide deacetylase family protein [Gemmatimonadaceae bacterium]
MAAEQLLRHLDWLASSRVRVVPLVDLVGMNDDTDAVALTFDDGLVNFGDVAAPLLAERGLPATVFIAPAHVGTWNCWDDANRPTIPRLSLLSWEEIRALSAQGFDFGGHGHTHVPLRGLTEAELTAEIEGCSNRITVEIGKKPRTFAYPYGACDDATVAAVSKSFEAACTTELRVLAARDSAVMLPRLDMYYFKDIAIGDLWGTVAFTPYVKLRAAGRTIRSLVRKL